DTNCNFRRQLQNPYGQHRNKRHDDKLRDNTNKNGKGRLAMSPKSTGRNVKPMPNMMMPSSGVTCGAKPEAVSGKKKPSSPPMITRTGKPSAAINAARSSRAVAALSTSDCAGVECPVAPAPPDCGSRELFIPS